MDRENAECHVRELEDQLAGLQEELRRETDNRADADTIHMVITPHTLYINTANDGLLDLACSH